MLRVFAAVIGRTDGIDVERHLLGRYQVAPAQLTRSKLSSCAALSISRSIAKCHFRTAGTAIGLGAHRVREHRARAQCRDGDVVRSGDQAGPFAERRQRDTARADIAQIIGHAWRGTCRCVDRHGDIRDQVTALIVGQKVGAYWSRKRQLQVAAGVLSRPFNL